MEFQEITEKEYRSFWEDHPQKTFLSAPEIAELRKDLGWEVYFLGVKEKKKIMAASMLFSHKRHFGKYEFYSPRGFLCDYENKELVDFFVHEIKKFIKEKKGYVLRIDPYVIYKQRDIDGNIVEGGEDHSQVVDHLLSLGFHKVDTAHKEQVGWMFSLDLDGKSEEEIFSSIKEGVYITDLQGIHAGINHRSGNFSLQSAGFMIRDGKIAEPLSLITIADNLLNLFNNIKDVANNSKLIIQTATTCPSIYVKKISVTGK